MPNTTAAIQLKSSIQLVQILSETLKYANYTAMNRATYLPTLRSILLLKPISRLSTTAGCAFYTLRITHKAAQSVQTKLQRHDSKVQIDNSRTRGSI